MGVTTVAELDICHDCAVVIVNGDDSADPERAAAAYDAAYAVWGDDLAHLVMACDPDDCGSHDGFRCDYCREDVYSTRHTFEILK